MRLRHLFPERHEGEVIACFGDARLIKTLAGNWELKGGSQDDHREAKEWISLFIHEVVVAYRHFTVNPLDLDDGDSKERLLSSCWVSRSRSMISVKSFPL